MNYLLQIDIDSIVLTILLRRRILWVNEAVAGFVGFIAFAKLGDATVLIF
jgi:hypothetical protein